MAEPLPEADLDTAVDPDRIAHQDFEIERRGFDQRQVRAYLIAVAESLRDAQAREADMRMRMGRAVRRAESAEQTARESQTKPAPPESDVARQVGDEVAGVLDAARVAGEQRVAAAETSAQQILKNATTEASKLRGAAETILAERRAEADDAVTGIIAKGEQQAEELRDQARHDHERARRYAMAMVGKARTESDSLIHEAEQAREQILEDMDRRRREARAQVERLRVGRDRLLRSYEVVRRSLDEATGELKISLTEAKVRGDSAARRVVGEPPTPPAQLEAEIADARLTGLIRIDEQPAHEVTETAEAPEAGGQQRSSAADPAVPNIDLRARPQKPAVSNPSAPTAPAASPSTAPSTAPASNASTFAARVTPSPSRPRVGAIETNDPAIRVVPKPPAVAPIIRREEPAVIAEADIDTADVDAADVEQVEEVEVIVDAEPSNVTALLVEAGVESDELVDGELVDEVAEDLATEQAAEPVEPVDLVVVDAEVTEAAELDAAEDVEVEVTEAAELDAAEDVEVEVTEAAELEVAEVEEADLSEEELDAVFAAELPHGELAIISPDDEIETVTPLVEGVDTSEAVDQADVETIDQAETAEDEAVAEPEQAEVAVEADEEAAEESAPAGGLFAALRQQRSEASAPEPTAPEQIATDADTTTEPDSADSADLDPAEVVDGPVDEAPDPTPPTTPPIFDVDLEEVYRQRDAVVAESANQLERRLKRALADEQNELLAGVRASKKKSVELISLVGDSDEHLSRYVTAIAEVATTAYSAGMALVQTDVTSTATLPAGAVEELIASSIIDPIRRRLEVASNDEPEMQLSTVRAFYRQRKTDDLPTVAADLASLLCTAGLCETLPPGTPLPR